MGKEVFALVFTRKDIMPSVYFLVRRDLICRMTSARSLYQLVSFSQVIFLGRRKKTYRRKPTPREKCTYAPED